MPDACDDVGLGAFVCHASISEEVQHSFPMMMTGGTIGHNTVNS